MLDRKAARNYVAILDIGSNAVRLVIYDGLNRAPFKIHNERRICSLGSDLGTTGRLSPEGVKKAMDAIRRFSGLLEAMKVRRVHALATAALRDASDGKDFIERVKKEFGLTIRVIDGDEEARLSALGVMMNGLGSQGLIGDFGGGSLELIYVDKGVLKNKVSLPLGSHRLQVVKGREARIKMIDDMLDATGFLAQLKGCDFYALGGAWRSMAKAHMRLVSHPLLVLDHYEVEGKKAHDYADLMSRQSTASLERTVGMSKKRVKDMGAAALVLERIFAKIKPGRLVFSATGLREGALYDLLKPPVRQQDALIASCRKIAGTISRFEDIEAFNILSRWMEPLFAGQSPHFLRLVEASCLLSDASWFEHEDYQAPHAFQRVLVLPFYGIDHPGRVFLALSQFVRYKGYLRRNARGSGRDITFAAQKIVAPQDIEAALIVGLAQRLGYLLTGGALTLLRHTELKITPKYLTLKLKGRADTLSADSIDDVLRDLAQALGREAAIEK